jgi:hypothetical protein
MAINQITINFEDCEPLGGYYIFYRPIGSVDPYRFAGIFFANPIVFTDENDPVNQEYEGYMQSHCGGGIFGDIVPWESSGSIPGESGEPSEPGEDECCDPVVLTGTAVTIIPDGSLPGSGSEPEEEVCCTPVILNACIETLDESGSGSGSSGSEPQDTFGIMMLFSAEAYAILELEDLTYWNAFYDTGTFADTPFDEILLYPEDLKIVLKGATNLALQNVWASDLTIFGFWDNSGSVTSMGFASFSGATNLEVVELLYTGNLGDNAFFGCTNLVSILATDATSIGSNCFQNCTSLANFSFPAVTQAGDNCFRNCSSVVSIDLPLVTVLAGGLVFRNISGPGTISINTPILAPYGDTAGDDSNFADTAGQTIEITLPTSEEFDGDIVAVQGTNTVTLILV